MRQERHRPRLPPEPSPKTKVISFETQSPLHRAGFFISQLVVGAPSTRLVSLPRLFIETSPAKKIQRKSQKLFTKSIDKHSAF
jgi:hypothetical protein